MVPPGGIAHCVMLGTPSEKGVRTCVMPCQCSVAPSPELSAFVTVTSTQSPSSTTMAGPGTVEFAAM